MNFSNSNGSLATYFLGVYASSVYTIMYKSSSKTLYVGGSALYLYIYNLR